MVLDRFYLSHKIFSRFMVPLLTLRGHCYYNYSPVNINYMYIHVSNQGTLSHLKGVHT